ncbi:hypothetical protein EJ05DRAFT_536178 [Pseudovirgaria hyperparasitica]|uniref:DUF7137 domain-containing protein n=1 Tax=Pseudovirgaria hyperparasitica TaxID=470096 RepID=A0A6A6WEZ6_9PEZI|nr:uncharacterized protein EJ05DRAFT_536178 [Pseudovirgaria hyperparasitica]KAF2761398.1 hypothetical protein EJ05DRAFT_536178 [Pseudovirgaria hyperparasitica]
MRPSQLLTTVFAASLASAFSFDSLKDINAVGGIEDILYRRQDNNDESASARVTDPPKTTGGKEPSRTGDNTAQETGSEQTGTERGTRTITSSPTESIDVDPRLPAGGISMITPSAIAVASYYKIGDWVTFAWNYTSLEVTPTAVDVVASCTKNQQLYTLAVNQTWEDSNTVFWDTGAYQASATVPLLTETYTLIVYDADSSISATPKAGYLGSSGSFTFGMYVRQPYSDLDSNGKFNCPTCNSGSSLLTGNEKQTLGFLFTMATITVLSFTWFGSGFGLF